MCLFSSQKVSFVKGSGACADYVCQSGYEEVDRGSGKKLVHRGRDGVLV